MKTRIKLLLVSALFGLCTGAAAAQETTATTPKPRPRIDPASIASPVPRRIEGPAASGAAQLPRYVVKEAPLTTLLLRRPGVEDPKGKFNLLQGGRFGEGKIVGPFSIEVGWWTHVDVLAPDAPGGSYDFLRIKW